MTPKQVLKKHCEGWHFKGGQNLDRLTERELQRWHGRQHHHFDTNHVHQDDSVLGHTGIQDQRPKGWKTGEDAVLRTDLPKFKI